MFFLDILRTSPAREHHMSLQLLALASPPWAGKHWATLPLLAHQAPPARSSAPPFRANLPPPLDRTYPPLPITLAILRFALLYLQQYSWKDHGKQTQILER